VQLYSISGTGRSSNGEADCFAKMARNAFGTQFATISAAQENESPETTKKDKNIKFTLYYEH